MWKKQKWEYEIKKVYKPYVWMVYILLKNWKKIHVTHYWKEKEDCERFLENIEKTDTYDYNRVVIMGNHRTA